MKLVKRYCKNDTTTKVFPQISTRRCNHLSFSPRMICIMQCIKSSKLEVYRYGNFGFYRYRLYFCQNLPIPITDPILILHMSSNYSLYLACIKLNGLATYYHVAKLPQHFYTLKLVNYGNIYNCYSNVKLI